jgi:hypothetical protein
MCRQRGRQHLYYLDTSNHPIEVAWDSGWKVTPLALHGAPPAAPGSAMTCFGVGGTATRLYYLDGARGSVNDPLELGWDGLWKVTPLATFGAPRTISGTALTCFGVGGTDTRLYYNDGTVNLKEVAWDSGWEVNKLPT